MTIYFIHQPEFYQRAGLYGENGVDYEDNAARYIFFSKAVTHLARYLPWQPEVVHLNDWQTGLVPLIMLHQKLHEGCDWAVRARASRSTTSLITREYFREANMR